MANFHMGNDSLYCLAFRNDQSQSEEELIHTFSEYGDVVSVRGAIDKNGFVFVRYGRKEDIESAYDALVNDDRYSCMGPGREKQSNESPRDPQPFHRGQVDHSTEIYMTSYPLDWNEDDINELISHLAPLSLKCLHGNEKRFSFAKFETEEAARRAADDLNNVEVNGCTLRVSNCADFYRKRAERALSASGPPNQMPVLHRRRTEDARFDTYRGAQRSQRLPNENRRATFDSFQDRGQSSNWQPSPKQGRGDCGQTEEDESCYEERPTTSDGPPPLIPLFRRNSPVQNELAPVRRQMNGKWRSPPTQQYGELSEGDETELCQQDEDSHQFILANFPFKSQEAGLTALVRQLTGYEPDTVTMMINCKTECAEEFTYAIVTMNTPEEAAIAVEKIDDQFFKNRVLVALKGSSLY